MRYATAAALFALLAALAGCGPEEFKHVPVPPLTLEQGAAKFQDKKSNTTVSEERPLPLQFIDSTGRQVDLASYQGKSNVLLVVVKGFPEAYNRFCPGCLAQVNTLVANYEEFKKRDAEILIVFPGSRDKLPQYLQEGKVDGEGGNPRIPFPVLLDSDSKAVNSLKIQGQLALPSTFIIDKQGSVVYGYVGTATDNYDRPSVKSLLAELDKLNKTK